MTLLADPNVWLAFFTLAALEIVLGIDNIIFISILVGRLPAAQRQRARIVGLALAMGMRIGLLLSIAWIMGLKAPLFELLDTGVSGRDLILIGGGLFLMAKSVLEIHSSLEGQEHHEVHGAARAFGSVIAQIAIVDIVFSLDSVITAVGMVKEISIMIAAVIIAVIAMLLFVNQISDTIKYPTVTSIGMLVGIALLLFLGGIGLWRWLNRRTPSTHPLTR